eukprot:COSAG01_NODE_16485_length_1233_cov_0.851852_2_plen_172_part_00
MGLTVCSHPFSDYIQRLQANKSDPVLCHPTRVKDEVNAEAFRIWALFNVMIATRMNVETVATAMTNAMFDTSSKDSIFSGYRIFLEFKFSEMVTKHHQESMERLAKGIKGRRKTPGPEHMLQRNDLTLEVRRKKLQEKETLATVIQIFQRYGVQPKNDDDPFGDDADFGYD